MKTLLLALLFSLVFAINVSAETQIVCTPQSDADGYTWSLNGGPWTDTTYSTFVHSNGNTYAIVANLGELPPGDYLFKVKAYKNANPEIELERPESTEVPFAFTVREVSPSQGLKLRRQ